MVASILFLGTVVDILGQVFLEELGSLDPFQSGLRPGFGVERALVTLTDYLCWDCDGGVWPCWSFQTSWWLLIQLFYDIYLEGLAGWNFLASAKVFSSVAEQCPSHNHVFSTGLNDCNNISSLEVYRGGSGSLRLSVNSNRQILVKKCDPQTKTWNEEILAAPGMANSLISKNTSISVDNGHFTVWNAEKTEEGVYKTEHLLDNRCLDAVTVTVIGKLWKWGGRREKVHCCLCWDKSVLKKASPWDPLLIARPVMVRGVFIYLSALRIGWGWTHSSLSTA